MPLRLLTALLLAAVVVSNVRAQRTDVAFERIKVPDMGHMVAAIVQDHEGFMWFTIGLGRLVKYDGYTFKKYHPLGQGSDQDEYRAIWHLNVDSRGAIGARRGRTELRPTTRFQRAPTRSV